METPTAIAELLAATPARVGLAVTPLNREAGYTVLDEEVFAQASAIKIPILWELHRAAAAGELDTQETMPIDPADGAGGCGVLLHFAAGASQVALSDLSVLMIVLSDNVATNLLINRLGFEAINALLESQGASETRIRRKMIDPEARKAGRENTSSPAEAAALMARLHQLASEGDAAARATLDTLRLRKVSPVTAALPKETRHATKPGMLDGLRTEWSLVETDDASYAMSLMADGADDSEIEPLFRKLTLAIHQQQTGVA